MACFFDSSVACLLLMSINAYRLVSLRFCLFILVGATRRNENLLFYYNTLSTPRGGFDLHQLHP